jgi:hypothetical protein
MKEPAISIPNEGKALRERFDASPAVLKESLCAYVSRHYVLIERELIGGRTTGQLAADISVVRNEDVSLTNLRTYLSKLRKKHPEVRARLISSLSNDTRNNAYQGVSYEGRRLPHSPPAMPSDSTSSSAVEIADENLTPRPAAKTYARLK